tara:strand:- start:19317 stop:20690 length:1374 start_codon:yes stop_codon:yes gene_type:complete
MTLHLPAVSQISMAVDVLEQGQRPRIGRVPCRIGEQILFRADVLGSYFFADWDAAAYDLLLVAGVIEYCDLSCPRSKVHWPRTFDLRIPVHDPELWNSPEVQIALSSAAKVGTSDSWSFEFTKRRAAHPSPLKQSLPLPNNAAFSMAFSDGLDSKSVAALLAKAHGPDAAMRIRVGQSGRDVANKRAFAAVPFSVKVWGRRESSFRSRGFKFAAISAVAAKLGKLHHVIVPESGQGALGPAILPLRPTSPDYRNHPRFFKAMERLVESVLQHAVSYEQPRLWSTKAETIREAHTHAGLSVDDIISTRSCWQKRNYVNFDGAFHQCGVCAACILRRVSLTAANIPESEDGYTFADLNAASVSEAARPSLNVRNLEGIEPHARAACRHMHLFGQIVPVAEDRHGFHTHASEIARAIGTQTSEVEKLLAELVERHAEEWRRFVNALDERSFVKDSIRGLG